MSTRPVMPTRHIDRNKYDLDRTGQITPEEIQQVKDIVEIEILGQRAGTQKKMAWAALWSMFIFTVLLFSDFVTDSRVNALADLLGLFYIAQAGVVGAYMGVTAWMSQSARSSRSTAYEQYTRPRPKDEDQ